MLYTYQYFTSKFICISNKNVTEVITLVESQVVSIHLLYTKQTFSLWIINTIIDTQTMCECDLQQFLH